MKVLFQMAGRFALLVAALLVPPAAPAQQLFTKPITSDLPMGGHNISNAGTVSATTLNGSLAWPNLSGVPTTLAGYGITDNVTVQGNSFNGSNQLVETTGGGALPALSGAGLTGLLCSQLTGGSGASYLFEGDSITYGQNLSSPATQCFQAVFATLPFAAGNSAVRNDAVSGSTLANIASRYVANVQPHRPTANGGDGGAKAYLILMIGINDAFTGRTGAQMLSDLTAYINQARTDGFTVVLATILPSSNAPTTYPAQETYNEAIRAGLVPYDLLWDANSVLTDPTNAAIFNDGIHPTAAAHARLACSLQSALMTQGGNVGAPAVYGTDQTILGVSYSSGVNINQPGSAAVLAAINSSSSTSAIFGFGNSGATPQFPVMDWYNGGVLQWAVQLDYQEHFKIFDSTTGSNAIQFLQGGAAPRVVIGNGTDDGTNILQVAGTGKFASTVTANGVAFGTRLSSSPSVPTYGIDSGGNGWLLMESVSNPIALNYWSGNPVEICPNGGAVSIGSGGLTVGSLISSTAGFSTTVPGTSLTVKSGTNALAGTVTLSSGAATITSSAIDANTVIVLSLKTSSGTPGTYMPRANVGSGSATVAGLPTDNSTYNWIGLKVN